MLGWPATLVGGVAGTLARSNAMRNPARTASTAAALMIGLALVTAVAVLAQGLEAPFEGSVTSEFNADYALTSRERLHADLGLAPPTRCAARGVATVVAGVRAGDGRALRQDDPGRRARAGHLAGAAAELEGRDERLAGRRSARTGAIVDSGFANSHHLTVGSPIRLETPAGKFIDLRVRAIFAAPQRRATRSASISISSATFDSLYPNPQNVFTLVDIAGRRHAGEHRRAERACSHSFPDAKIQTEQQFINTQEQGLNTLSTCSTSCSGSRSSSASSGS